MLSYQISKRHGRDGLPEDTIRIKLHGTFRSNGLLLLGFLAG